MMRALNIEPGTLNLKLLTGCVSPVFIVPSSVKRESQWLFAREVKGLELGHGRGAEMGAWYALDGRMLLAR